MQKSPCFPCSKYPILDQAIINVESMYINQFQKSVDYIPSDASVTL